MTPIKYYHTFSHYDPLKKFTTTEWLETRIVAQPDTNNYIYLITNKNVFDNIPVHLRL